jgi:aconitate hydratase
MEKKRCMEQFKIKNKRFNFFNILNLEKEGFADIQRLPFSIRILVENLVRKMDGRIVREEDLFNIARWQKTYAAPVEIPFHPARVLMQDFTGVPAVVDLAAMRDAVEKLGGNPEKVNPLVPVDLIVDHSVQVDFFGTDDAVLQNVKKEYARNAERYALLKWAQQSFDNFRVVPPRSGICHQVNLENVGQVVIVENSDGRTLAYPDTLVGLDSHTTMINGVGVLGWGVGGIEAEAVMLGQPYYMSIPPVIGVRLSGRLKPEITATDLVLTITEMLRNYGVVEKFVEYFGPGLKNLTVPDRATIANMAPEYGATLGFFPVDEKTVEYLKMTDRPEQAGIVEAYTRASGLFYSGGQEAEYSAVLQLDLSAVERCVAGPARPQDRIALKDLKSKFADILGCKYERDAELQHISQFHEESGTRTRRAAKCVPLTEASCRVDLNGQPAMLGNGSIVIAAITSCTNTSNPFVMLGAGLMARNAVRRGLRPPPFVKTSLAPGSKVVIQYLVDAGLMPYLKGIGFHLAAFGCTTCIGNSGALHPAIEQAIVDHDLNVAAVLSGNRNFEARIHQQIKSNFLASPMLVVAFALAGRVDIDLTIEPLGLDPNGRPVYLEDIWPAHNEIQALIRQHVKKDFFALEYGRIFDGDEFWQQLPDVKSVTYAWDEKSTYIKHPPYFDDFSLDVPQTGDLENARALAVLGDSVTTDHISPAGAISQDYPAGRYLTAKGIPLAEFNSYGSRRGNHEVMLRGTFGNIRLKNKLAGTREGSYTVKFPEKSEMYIYDAAMAYQRARTPLVVLGGKEYGAGSSRDWAAKGTQLLGVKAVIAQSFERIHRSNLVGMGVLPLVFKPGEDAQSLGLDGSETYFISGLEDIRPRQPLAVRAVKSDGSEIRFEVSARLDTDIEIDYCKNGGILPYVLRKIMGPQ